jgi:hypothetical protein
MSRPPAQPRFPEQHAEAASSAPTGPAREAHHRTRFHSMFCECICGRGSPAASVSVMLGLVAIYYFTGQPESTAFLLGIIVVIMCAQVCLMVYQHARTFARWQQRIQLLRGTLQGTPPGPGEAIVEIRGAQSTSVVRIPASHLQLMLRDGDFAPEDYDALLALDDHNSQPALRGAEPQEIRALPTFKFTPFKPRPGVATANCSGAPAEEANKTCAVCLEEYAEHDTLRILPCMHRFHVNCIDHWLEQRATCPVCKCHIADPNLQGGV